MPGIEVLDRAHHKTVEQRDVPLRARAGLNAPTRQEAEVLENSKEALFPDRTIPSLDGCQRMGDPAPAVGDRRLLAVAIFRPPDTV